MLQIQLNLVGIELAGGKQQVGDAGGHFGFSVDLYDFVVNNLGNPAERVGVAALLNNLQKTVNCVVNQLVDSV